MSDDDKPAPEWLADLRTARSSLAMSLQTLANRSGLSYQTVQGTFVGRNFPQRRALDMMLAVLLPDGSEQADKIRAAHQRTAAEEMASRVHGGATFGASFHLVNVLEAGLADIAAAIREGNAQRAARPRRALLDGSGMDSDDR